MAHVLPTHAKTWNTLVRHLVCQRLATNLPTPSLSRARMVHIWRSKPSKLDFPSFRLSLLLFLFQFLFLCLISWVLLFHWGSLVLWLALQNDKDKEFFDNYSLGSGFYVVSISLIQYLLLSSLSHMSEAVVCHFVLFISTPQPWSIATKQSKLSENYQRDKFVLYTKMTRLELSNALLSWSAM
jgi:hypothetical protein